MFDRDQMAVILENVKKYNSVNTADSDILVTSCISHQCANVKQNKVMTVEK